MALTDKQETFCVEYLIDLTLRNRLTGYSAKAANRTASLDLSTSDV